MTNPIERRRLAEFVDRTREMERFSELLESDEKHIMVVWGGAGMGKTSLKLRMVHECAQRGVRKSEIECGQLRTINYLAIMRKIRDDMDIKRVDSDGSVNCFHAFTDYVSYLHDPNYSVNIHVHGAIDVAAGARIGDNATVGSIAGAIIKDNMFVHPRSDLDVPEEQRIVRLTDHFLDGLRNLLGEFAAAPRQGKLVVFLDAVEKVAPDTERWIWDELLMAVREGRLADTKFVLCGQHPPKLDQDWRMLVEEVELRPLELEHIELYLEKRGVDPQLRQGLATFLLATTQGKVLTIAENIDAFLKFQKSKAGR